MKADGAFRHSVECPNENVPVLPCWVRARLWYRMYRLDLALAAPLYRSEGWGGVVALLLGMSPRSVTDLLEFCTSNSFSAVGFVKSTSRKYLIFMILFSSGMCHLWTTPFKLSKVWNTHEQYSRCLECRLSIVNFTLGTNGLYRNVPFGLATSACLNFRGISRWEVSLQPVGASQFWLKSACYETRTFMTRSPVRGECIPVLPTL